MFSVALSSNTISVEKLPSDYPEIFVAGIFPRSQIRSYLNGYV
jgi:hypothetical protein